MKNADTNCVDFNCGSGIVSAPKLSRDGSKYFKKSKCPRTFFEGVGGVGGKKNEKWSGH